MPIQTACPHCNENYTLADEKLGKTVRCRQCQETFTVQAQQSSNPPRSDESAKPQTTDEGIQVGQRKANARDDDDDDRDDDAEESRPKKKKKKKSKDNSLLVVGIGGGVLVAVLLGVGLFWFLSPKNEEQQAKKNNDNPLGNAFQGQEKKENRPMMPKPGPGDPNKKDNPNLKGDMGKPKDPMGKQKDPMGKPKDPLKPNDPRDPRKGKDKEVVPVKTPVKDNYPELADNDPIKVNYEKLTKDRRKFPAENKEGAEFFLRTDPRERRDVDGLFAGFKDHPWRGKVSKGLELLLGHQDPAIADTALKAYLAWAVPEDFSKMELHMERHREHRQLFLKRFADFRDTPEAMQLIVDHLTSTDQAEVVKLIKDLGGKPCQKFLVPYLWHPDPAVAALAYDLVKGFGMPIDHELYQGPVELKPRLPEPTHEMTFEEAVKNLGSQAAKGDKADWKSEARFRQLRTLAWLQQQTVSKPHVAAVSRALDPLTQSKDQLLASNALDCLSEVWGTEANISTFKKCYDSNSDDNKRMAVKALKQVPGDKAQTLLIDLWGDMDAKLQTEMKMKEYMLAIDDEQPRMALIKKYFNHKSPQHMDTAREASRKWKINNDALIDICVSDLSRKESQLSALRWLKEQEPPGEERKKKALPQIENLARPTVGGFADPKATPAEQQAIRIEAALVMAKWGKETNDSLIALLEDPANLPANKTLRYQAMQKLADAKAIQAVSVIALRYRFAEDKDAVIAALSKMGPQLVDAKLRDALNMPSQSKENKLHLLKVIEQVSASRDLYDSLGFTLKQQPNLDPELSAAMTAAREAIESRLPKK